MSSCISCQGVVRSGRCTGCRRWQLKCQGCGQDFTARRRTARSCGQVCEKRVLRGGDVDRLSRTFLDTDGRRVDGYTGNIADSLLPPVQCAWCGVVLARLEVGSGWPTYCRECVGRGVCCGPDGIEQHALAQVL